MSKNGFRRFRCCALRHFLFAFESLIVDGIVFVWRRGGGHYAQILTMTLYSTSAYKYTESEQAVLRDLFTRIPSKDLLYGCRGASCKWHAMLIADATLQSRLRQRADSMRLIVEEQRSRDPFLPCSAVPIDQQEDASPLRRCLGFVRLTTLKWHREFIMRAYRSASIRPLFELSALWKERLASDFNDRLTKEMYECSKQAAVELQNRVLLDSNDRLAEKRSAEIDRNGATAATVRWQEESDD